MSCLRLVRGLRGPRAGRASCRGRSIRRGLVGGWLVSGAGYKRSVGWGGRGRVWSECEGLGWGGDDLQRTQTPLLRDSFGIGSWQMRHRPSLLPP